MTSKEISERLRSIAADSSGRPLRHIIESLADELDPPHYEPSTVVFCIVFPNGEVHNNLFLNRDDAVKHATARRYLSSIDIIPVTLPACIVRPQQVTITVPDISEWPEDSDICEVYITFDNHYGVKRVQRTIFREEAKRMGGRDDK